MINNKTFEKQKNFKIYKSLQNLEGGERERHTKIHFYVEFTKIMDKSLLSKL